MPSWPAEAALVPELQGEADDGVALGAEQRGDGGGVDAAGHGDGDGIVGLGLHGSSLSGTLSILAEGRCGARFLLDWRGFVLSLYRSLRGFL